MAGKLGGMSPVQHLVGNKKRSRWAGSRVRFRSLGLLYGRLYFPGQRSDNTSGRENGRVTGNVLGDSELTRESIGFGVARSRPVSDSELKPSEEQGPPDLLGIEPFC